MNIEDLLGKTLTLKTIRRTYSGGAEHLSLTFLDSETGEKVRVSIFEEMMDPTMISDLEFDNACLVDND